MTTLVEATETFLNGCDYLGDSDLPLVTLMRKTAETIDSAKEVPAALANQYRLTYLALAEKASDGSQEVDPLEALLEGRN